jgi:UDP-N-acetylglucosamine 2-epimerase (non-hydrolysing)
MTEARIVLTDSGGVQEETAILSIPCLSLRENTERPVTVTEGTDMIIGAERRDIVAKALAVLRQPCVQYRVPELWDGHAAERIVQILLKRFH